MPVHQLEHEVSALKDDVAHGAGLAVLIPSWMDVVWKKDKNKFIKFSKNVMRIENYIDEEDLVIKGIDKLKEFFKKLKMPTRLREFNINENDLEYMSNHLTQNGTYVFPSNIPLDYNLALEIYKNCL